MVLSLTSAFTEWDQPHNGISCIVIQGAGDKAFCSGGDLPTLLSADPETSKTLKVKFGRAEYVLLYQISMIQKPYVALLDGYTMGAGCGLTMNQLFRVSTERTVAAMPECFVGHFPDVGASRFLNNLQPGLGKYLGITGARLKGQEVKVSGLSTHHIPSNRIPEVLERLSMIDSETSDKATVDEILKSFEDPEDLEEIQRIREKLAWISACFQHDNMKDIKDSLNRQEGEKADLSSKILKDISKGSPLSICLTIEQLKRGRDLDVKKCLEMELKMMKFFLKGLGDFDEGVRTILMDKQGVPDWKFKSIEEVPSSLVEECFNQSYDIGNDDILEHFRVTLSPRM